MTTLCLDSFLTAFHLGPRYPNQQCHKSMFSGLHFHNKVGGISLRLFGSTITVEIVSYCLICLFLPLLSFFWILFLIQPLLCLGSSHSNPLPFDQQSFSRWAFFLHFVQDICPEAVLVHDLDFSDV